MKIVKSLCIKKIFTTMVLLCMFGLVPSSVTAQKDPIILNPTNPAVSAGECNDGKDNNSNGKIDYPADSDCSSSSDKTEGESYKLLAPLPIFGSIFSASGKSFGEYLSIMFTFLVSFAGVLAVVMLIFGGIQYMSTDSLSGTESGRAKMTQAIYGLIIVLASYVILNTVNPNLVKFNFSIQGQTIEIDEEVASDVPHAASNGKYCSSRYQSGSAWTPPDDSSERASLQAVGVSVNHGNCSTVGSAGCTSLKGLSSQAIQKLGQLKSSCSAFSSACQIVVTGGTECWLHSSKTAHLPGNAVVDLRDDIVVDYISTISTKSQTKSKGWMVYKIDSGPLKGAVIVDEGDHLHVNNW